MSRSGTPYEEKLLAVLAQHGVDGPWISALDAWRAFKEFGNSFALEERTGFLFQVGTYDFEGPPLFYFDLVFQIESVDRDGEHQGFEHLHCELTCPPTQELQDVAIDLWSFTFPNVDAFYAAVEALPEFGVAVGQGNYRLRVSRESV